MPEMSFSVRWPDGLEQSYYSPSLVVHEHLEVAGSYPVPDFLTAATTALGIASERVAARYGAPCARAAASADAIEAAARRQPAGAVTVLAMHPPPAADQEAAR